MRKMLKKVRFDFEDTSDLEIEAKHFNTISIQEALRNHTLIRLPEEKLLMKSSINADKVFMKINSTGNYVGIDKRVNGHGKHINYFERIKGGQDIVRMVLIYDNDQETISIPYDDGATREDEFPADAPNINQETEISSEGHLVLSIARKRPQEVIYKANGWI